MICFFFSSRRRHTRSYGDWSSDVCSSDLEHPLPDAVAVPTPRPVALVWCGSEGGLQFFADGRLDRDADVLVDQFAQRDGLELMRSCGFLDTLAHGAFLR